MLLPGRRERSKINKKSLYFSLCDKADAILIESGIRKICTACSTKRGWKERPGWLESKLGCCGGYSTLKHNNDCKYLGKNGCKVKSLGCKLHLCNVDEMEKMIEKSGRLVEWLRLEHKAREAGFGLWCRNPEYLIERR